MPKVKVLQRVLFGAICLLSPFTLLGDEAQLALVCRAPKQRYLGQMCSYDIEVKNTGLMGVNNIRIELVFPENSGVKILANKEDKGKHTVIWEIPELAAGNSKQFSVRTIVVKAMALVAEVMVSAENIKPIKKEVKTDVKGLFGFHGELVDLNDPIPVGASAIYEMTFSNTGSKEIHGLKLSFQWDKPLKLVKISGDQKVTPKDNILFILFPNTLKPRDDFKFRIELQALTEGDSHVAAAFDCKELTRPVSLSESTTVYPPDLKDKDRDAPAILCLLSDVNDPVKVGQSETYKILLKNQGTADLTNIQIFGLLDQSMELVNIDGETKIQEKTKDKLTFKVLPVLKPQATATWFVTVNAKKAADARFHVEFRCDQLARPIVREESTNFYE